MTALRTQNFIAPLDRNGLVALLVRLTTALLVVWGVLHFAGDWRSMSPSTPVELTLHAYLPSNGGWVSEPLQVESGQPVRLSIKTVEGAHALRIGHTDIESGILPPQSISVLDFTAPAPGRYVLACTLWCGPDHWRMRTVLDVVDPADPDAPIQYTQDDPRYAIPWSTFDMDAPHPAAVWPEQSADLSLGAAIWQSLATDRDPAQTLDELGWPLTSPAQVYQTLTADSDFTALDDVERWALLAFLWQAKRTPDELARGAAIYTRECASCHDDDGSGNGFAATESPAVEPDFRYAPMAAGAAPMQYYAKIARGGMGTGMPNWGTLLSEDELWAVTGYLYTFMFNDPHTESSMGDSHNSHVDQ